MKWHIGIPRKISTSAYDNKYYRQIKGEGMDLLFTMTLVPHIIELFPIDIRQSVHMYFLDEIFISIDCFD